MSRGLKQFAYGAGFLLFFSVIIFGGYALLLKPAATCFDKIQNQKELGADCGGPCAPCEQKYAKDIEVENITKFPAGDAKTVVLISIKNPNDDYGVRDVLYTVEAKGANGEVLQMINDHTFMYDRKAKSGRYLVVTVNTAMENIFDVVVTFSGPDVVPSGDFIEPAVVVKQSTTDITGLKKITEPVYVFTKDIGMKTTGPDVFQLETFLAKKGFFKKTPDGTFDLDTKLALTEYQKSRKVVQAKGIFDAATRKMVNGEIDTITKIVVDQDSSVVVNGNIKNNGVVKASKVIITSFVYDQSGVLLGVSQTELENMDAAAERAFRIIFPKTVHVDLIDVTRTKIFVDSIQ
jgi:hypothetical protein